MISLKETYTLRRAKVLVPLAGRIEDHLKNLLGSFGRIDRISARAKSVDRFLGKAAKLKERKTRKYEDPLNQIQDQAGSTHRYLLRKRCRADTTGNREIFQIHRVTKNCAGIRERVRL